MGKLQYIRYFMKNSWFVFRYRLFHHKKNVTRFLGKKGITLDYSDEKLCAWIESGKPFAAVRFGAVELSCINNAEKIRFHWKKDFKPSVVYSIKNGAGVFPCDKEHLLEYDHLVRERFSQCDLLGISGIHMEDYFYRLLCPKAETIQYEAFEPLRGNWIQCLKGKKVLVISPFAEDIQKQYQKRDFLFPKGFMPDFTLMTMKAVQTIGSAEDHRYQTWTEALQAMEEEIKKYDFDIALVGAGAYGSPLCVKMKEMGKQAIQTGGATQTMFGIIGKRWENRPHVSRFINDDWIRPTEKPLGYENVEKGCYW